MTRDLADELTNIEISRLQRSAGKTIRYEAAECFKGCDDQSCPYVHSDCWRVDGDPIPYETEQEAKDAAS